MREGCILKVTHHEAALDRTTESDVYDCFVADRTVPVQCCNYKIRAPAKAAKHGRNPLSQPSNFTKVRVHLNQMLSC